MCLDIKTDIYTQTDTCTADAKISCFVAALVQGSNSNSTTIIVIHFGHARIPLVIVGGLFL